MTLALAPTLTLTLTLTYTYTLHPTPHPHPTPAPTPKQAQATKLEKAQLAEGEKILVKCNAMCDANGPVLPEIYDASGTPAQ